MPAFLVPVDAGQCLIPLEKAIVLIGRQADCDVSLTHSRKISRRHCCVAQVNNKFVVRDLGSTNGVFLNGSRIEKECVIQFGDNLVIGDVRYTFQEEAPAMSRSEYARLAKSGSRPMKKPSSIIPPPVPPPIPGIRRSSTILEPADESDEMDSEPEADPTIRSPDTLDGIRRHRSHR